MLAVRGKNSRIQNQIIIIIIIIIYFFYQSSRRLICNADDAL